MPWQAQHAAAAVLPNRHVAALFFMPRSPCTLSAAISAAVFSVWLLGRLPIFQRAYSEHIQRLEDDAWLQAQCGDPHFISRMRQHADVCDRVRASFQQPALLVGLQACVPSELKDLLPSVGWESVALAALLLVAAPSVLLPYFRARSDRHDRDRLLEACSPDLPPFWRVAQRLPQHRRIVAAARASDLDRDDDY